ncbi:hypothetical protein Tco_0888128 [Tanacetum coccineum]
MPVSKANIHVSNSKGAESSNSVRRPQSKDTKLKNRVLKNTNAKSSSAYVQKVSSSVRIGSNKRETKNLNECQSNVSVLNNKNVTAVNDGSNLVCVTCVAKSRNLGATSVVAKSRLGVSKTPTATNKSSRGFSIYNCQTKKIMETIHVKFDELTTIASECNNSGPSLNCSNFQDSSDDMNEIPSQQDLDNLFGPLYEEYYASSTFEVTNNFAVNTLDVEDTPSLSSIIVEDSDAP